LDRGQRADWFDSYEIIILTCLAVAALYIFLARVATADRPFLRPILFKDRNFAVGVALMFVFGLLNFTPITLLPTLLQNLRGYPDSVIGYVLAIRGLGTLAGFFFMIMGSRIDPRLMVVAGFATQGISGWYMAQMDLNVMLADLFWPMIVQGFGVGLLWPSITAITFSTLNQKYLDEATGFYHLIRNMGSSIYISISMAVIMRTSSQRYAEMTDHISPFNQNFDLPWASGGWSATTTEGLSHLGSEIGRQAAMIGYNNSFYMFSITAFAFIPLVLLIRWKKGGGLVTVKEDKENVHD
jgi:DHA2 family multidrug resistance protein